MWAVGRAAGARAEWGGCSCSRRDSQRSCRCVYQRRRSTQAQTELRRRSTLRSSRERTDRSGAAADRTCSRGNGSLLYHWKKSTAFTLNSTVTLSLAAAEFGCGNRAPVSVNERHYINGSFGFVNFTGSCCFHWFVDCLFCNISKRLCGAMCSSRWSR